MPSVAELYSSLNGDAWRVQHPFSAEILEANALLHNPGASEEDLIECGLSWCQNRQSCQFGKAAAKQGRIHFCFLREEAVSTWSDEEIAEKIDEEKKLWKQRAASDPSRAAHSFLLVVAAPRVAFAAPDHCLRAFSDRILELTGWSAQRKGARRVNTLNSDFLYLRNPSDRLFYGFQFNVDFFACAGDKTWWHDHRFPGGITFTANSVGHMIRFREWYEGKPESEDWALIQAMLTIAHASRNASVEQKDARVDGRVTWLRDLDSNGKPLVEDLACPLMKMPSVLVQKDWTRYEGLLHTDHAVREEFFVGRRDVAPTTSKAYLMDFTYLYDPNQADYRQFAAGTPVAEADVFAQIGRPSEWTNRIGPTASTRTEEEAATVAQQLLVCRKWSNSPWYEVES
jgi:hypothetical protein